MMKLRMSGRARCARSLGVVLVTALFLCGPVHAEPFVRGDVDGDGVLGLTDAVRLFGHLFLGDPVPPCLDAADANDSGTADISDGIYDLGFLFLGTPQPPAPFPECGTDPTEDALDCASFPPCDATGVTITAAGRVAFEDGGPVVDASVSVSVVLDETVAAIAAHLVRSPEGKTVQPKSKDGRAAGVPERAILAVEAGADATTDADGRFSVEVGPAELPVRMLVEVSYSPPDAPVVEQARWETAEAELVDFGTILIPNPAASEVIIEDGAGETDDGSVRVENLPPEVDRFFANSYDPDESPDIFPGEFTEMGTVPLNSTVFVWLEALDADGNPVEELGQAASIRTRIPRTQWSDIEDTRNGTDRIELPIYVYDEETDMWEEVVQHGWVEDAVGTILPEEVEPLIASGTFEGDIYASFVTDHFSWMNVDYAYIGAWTLSRLTRARRNVDCLYQATQLAKKIARSRAGITAYKKFAKPTANSDADVLTAMADRAGPELRSANMTAYGHFKGNEEGDRDDQFYMRESLWDGCDGTAAQKKATIFIMAVTILHETAHWKWDVIHEDGNWRNREPGGEAGNELERDLFGGILSLRGGRIYRDGTAVNDATLNGWLNHSSWPAPAGGGGEGLDGGVPAGDVSPLEIAVTFEQASYELGADIFADVTYTNTSAEPISILTLEELEGYPLAFEIVKDGETERVPYRGARLKREIDWENDFLTLAPGATHELSINLARDGDGLTRYNLVQSGLHHVTAVYSGHYGLPETASPPSPVTRDAGGSISGLGTNAESGAPLAGATVRALLDDIELARAESGPDGRYLIPELPGGMYDVEARAPQFLRTTQADVEVIAGQDTVVNFSLSALLTAGELRAVLTWGEAPRDLDSHLWLPMELPYHVYYSRRGGLVFCPYAELDVDDTSSFGPETITISQRFDGTYNYAVYNYTGSPDLTESEAMVQLFDSSGLIATYEVPQGGGPAGAGGGGGRWWHVFSLDGETGAVTEINTLGDDPAPYGDTDIGCDDVPIDLEGDDCADPVDADEGQTIGTTIGATNDGSASCASSGTAPDVWYRYTAASDFTLTLDLCGSSYDTALSIHSACPGSVENELACNDDSCGLQSMVEIQAEADTTYWIRVAGYGGDTGNFVLNVQCSANPQ